MAYYEGQIADIGCNNGGNGGFGSDWGDLAALIVVAGLFGWGNGGIGGFGGNRGGYGCGCGTPATQADLANGFAQNTLQRGIDDIILGQATMQNFINQGFSGLNSTITTGFSGVDNAICTLGYQNQAGFNALGSQIASCCCDIRTELMQNRYLNEKQTCDILAGQNAQTRAILDYLTSEKISALQAENSGLKAQISNDKQSAYLISQLKEPCPTPAYVVPNPNCCYNYGVVPFGTCGASVQ